MATTHEIQLCASQNKQIRFQVEKEYHLGLQIERVRKYCLEDCPRKPTCKQAEQCFMTHR